MTKHRPMTASDRKVKRRLPKINVLDDEYGAERWNMDGEDEHTWWPRVLWIDPGVVSGVAVIWFDPKQVFAGQPLARCILAYSELFLNGPEYGQHGQATRFLRMQRNLNTQPGLATGAESFKPRQINLDDDFLSPVRIRAAIEMQLSLTRPPGAEVLGDGIPLHVQSPSDALTTFNNDRLRQLQMYTPGPDHVNDAKRHALLWIRKLRAAGVQHFFETHGFEPGWDIDA
jgi:hypothetical protein